MIINKLVWLGPVLSATLASPAFARDRFLLGEVAVGKHPCDLYDTPQLDFSPPPPNIRSA